MFGFRRRDAVDKAALTEQLYGRNLELAVRNKMLSLLRRLGQLMLTEGSAKHLAEGISKELVAEFNFCLVGIALSTDPKDPLAWLHVAGVKEVGEVSGAFSGSAATLAPRARMANPCVKALTTNKSVVVSGAQGIFPPKFLSILAKSGSVIRTTLIFPFAVDEGSAGVLVVALRRGAKDLTRYEKETFQNLISLVTVGFQKTFLYEHLRDATAELHEANQKLVQLDAAKTEFLSIASHQLRTPLSIIRGYIAMMQENSYGKLSKAQIDVVGKVRTSAETLIELVNHLLNVSRIESGRITVTTEEVDLTKICVDVSSFLSLKAKEQKLDLECKAKKMPKVMGDPSKVKEVIMNLVENALKYTEAGSVTVNFFDEPKFVKVEVRDTGRGLTKDDLGKLFQKFSRGSASADNRVSGTGLGLYVCKRLVEAMGGEIWAESEGQGKGSVFAFRLKKAPVKNKAIKKVAR